MAPKKSKTTVTKTTVKKPAGLIKAGLIKKRPASSGSVLDEMQHVEDELTNMSATAQKEIRAKRRVLELAAAATKAGTANGEELPGHVMEMITIAQSKTSGKNEAMRKIALAAVEKIPGKNKYKLVVQQPFFEEYKAKYEEKYGLSVEKGETESFMTARIGGPEAMKAAIDSGEVEVIQDEASGKTFYKRFEIEAGRKVGSISSSRVGGVQKITKMMADEAVKAIEALEWKLASTPATKAKKFIEGGCDKVWLDQVKKAIAGAEKCLADAVKTRKLLDQPGLPVPSVVEHKETLRVGIAKQQEALSSLSMYAMLEEFGDKTPDKVRTEIGTCIGSTRSLHDTFQMMKAFVHKCKRG